MNFSQPVLIIGQGIAGSLLSFELYKKNIPFIVMDCSSKNSASTASGAVLNPYSGKTEKGVQRRLNMYNAAINTYSEWGKLLDAPILQYCELISFNEDSKNILSTESGLNTFFYKNKIEHIEKVAVVQNETLLKLWRRWLDDNKLLIEEEFNAELLQSKHGLRYNGKSFSKIVYCNGVAAMEDPIFSKLPFTRNRGDVLILEIPGLPEHFIFQVEGVRLIPKGNHIFWCGSNYLWEYDDMKPNKEWEVQTLDILKRWLKIPFELKNHICAKRPTTAGQIPAIGYHPNYPEIEIFNGLGTKGYSAGPFWIKDFVAKSFLNEEKSSFQSFLDKHLKVMKA
ncbi:MAG TPA: hypothetical protein PKX92_10295 [Edaphocola sp.]|nr:hypothetical protein [Edaphocola sp.]